MADDLTIIKEQIKLLEDKLALEQDSKKIAKELGALYETQLEIQKQEIDLKETLKIFQKDEGKLQIKLLASITQRLKIGKNFLENEKNIKKIETQKKTISDQLNSDTVKQNKNLKKFFEEKEKFLEKEILSLKATNQMVGQIAGKWGISAKRIGQIGNILDGIGQASDYVGQGFTSIFGTLKKGFDIVTGIWGSFDEIDRVIREISVNMGITQSQLEIFAKNATQTAAETAKMGIHMDKVIRAQETMSELMGRNLLLTKEQIVAVAQMSNGTDLGVEGVARMGDAFEVFGVNLDSMRNRIEGTLQTNQKLGLNSSKVFKTISDNLKTAQKFNFKDGVQGLTRMAQKATSIKLDLGGVFGLAEKLFDVEGAVDLSAELQVLGGSFAKLADPFQLMYQARNDMEGLTDSLIEATKNVAVFDDKAKEFKIPAMELHRLKKVADATGISFENLTESALEMAKQDKAMSQLTNSFKFTDQERKTIANMAQMTDNGVMTITASDGTQKALSALDPEEMDKILGSQSTLEKAAKARMTFLDMFKSIGDVFKGKLYPVLADISQRLLSSGILDKMQIAADKIGGMLASLFEGDKLKTMMDKAFGYIDTVINTIMGILNGSGGFGDKIIKVGGELVSKILWEGIKMIIGPLLGGGVGAIAGGLLSGGNPMGIAAGAHLGAAAGGYIQHIMDGEVRPNGMVISQPTPAGLKPVAQVAGDDTLYARKNGGGGSSNINATINFGILKVDLGMGVSKDFREELLRDANFMAQITMGVKEKTRQIMNGTA